VPYYTENHSKLAAAAFQPKLLGVSVGYLLELGIRRKCAAQTHSVEITFNKTEVVFNVTGMFARQLCGW